MITRDKISQWSLNISLLARSLADQMIIHVKDDSKDLEGKLLYTKLQRHSTILSDISSLLKINSDERMLSCFILSRCMIEDFIAIFYIKTEKYDPVLIEKWFSQSYKNRFKFMDEVADFNQKFFNGTQSGLIPFIYVRDQKNLFANNTDHGSLFTDRTKFKLVEFPDTREIIKRLPVNDSTIANALSFLHWIHYSEYVHHSILSSYSDTDPILRSIEVKQYRSIMLYAYKMVEIIHDRLIERNVPVTFEVDKELIDDLTEASLNSTV